MEGQRRIATSLACLHLCTWLNRLRLYRLHVRGVSASASACLCLRRRVCDCACLHLFGVSASVRLAASLPIYLRGRRRDSWIEVKPAHCPPSMCVPCSLSVCVPCSLRCVDLSLRIALCHPCSLSNADACPRTALWVNVFALLPVCVCALLSSIRECGCHWWMPAPRSLSISGRSPGRASSNDRIEKREGKTGRAQG